VTLPILDFLVERMQEYDSTFEHRKGTAFSDLFMQPLSFIIQPLRDEANDIHINQSLKKIRELEDPNLWYEDAVDDLVDNLFVYRRSGSQAGGVVRMYYLEPQDVNYLQNTLTFTSSSNNAYFNTENISITAEEMALNIEDEFYYVEVPIEAEEEGDDYDADIGEIISVSDTNIAKVSNVAAISGGADRETNLELMARTQKSIGVRDMNTGKGFNAIMFEQFLTKLTELQAIGFGDPEMMRDICFNYHIGGRIDGYVKTPTILDGEFDVRGLTIDYDRRLSTLTNIILEGTSSVELGKQNLDITENDVLGYNIDYADKSAVFYSYVNLSSPIDLSTNQYIRVGIDQADPINIKISGAIPSTTQSGEIINRINVGLGLSVASLAVNPVVISRRSTGNIGAIGTTFIDPTPSVFANVQAGDYLVILVGNNKESYEITSVTNDNYLEVDGALPFLEAETNVNYRINRTGTYLKLLSPTKGPNSKIFIGSPTLGTDALLDAIGMPAGSYNFEGKGQTSYLEGVDYSVDLTYGTITRLLGTTILSNTLTGSVDKSIYFSDATTDIFLNVEAGDVVTVFDATTDEYIGDHRVLEKINNNILRLDRFFATTEGSISYRITRTGIKDGDMVQFTFDYNPMTIDIGDQIQLDEYGRELGIRTGREDQTITDLAFLYIKQIELINPVTGEPLDVILDGKGGYGRGGYGRGGYGRGSQAQYFLKVNKPELRFSALEDSFIAIDTAYLGQSFKVSYRYVPEVVEFQSFADSDTERVLDAHVLLKHFLPAVVDIEAEYTTDPTNPNTPDVDTVIAAVEDYINKVQSGVQLDASDITSVIYEKIDASNARNVKVKTPISMVATIHNTDGTQTVISSSDTLQVPEEDLPPYTTAPLSPRIVHWVAGNINITANVVTNSGVI